MNGIEDIAVWTNPEVGTAEYARVLREWKLFEPIVKETGVTHTAEEIEARRQEHLKRGNR